MQQPETPTGNDAPFGKTAGLLAANVTTLIGIVREVSPEMIVLRAVVVGFVCGGLARVVVLLLRALARTS